MQLGPSELTNDSAIQPTDQPIDRSAQTPSTAANQPTELTASSNQPVAIERLINRFSSPNTLLIFGVLLALVIMLRMVRKNHKSNAKRSNRQLPSSKRIASINSHAQASMEPVTRLMVEAEEMTRRLGAILDNKAARLELLIEEADRKLNELNRTNAAQQAPQFPQSNTPQPNQSQPTRTIDPSLLDRARMEQDHEERQTRVAGRIEPTDQPTALPPVLPVTQPPQPEPEPISIQQQIIELAATGSTSTEIARQLNQPVGQVELILNLRKQQG